MTVIRRVALRILNAIIRHAPPGIRDWGVAALREMDFIENDWRALFWAMGSVTLLFQPEVKTMGEAFDIPRKTQWLKKQIRRRTIVGSVVCLFLVFCFWKFSLIAPNSVARIGALLTVASMLFLEYQVHHWRGRAWPRRDVGTSDLQSFFRVELERQRDFHRGVCFWARLASMIPGYVLFCVGMGMANPATEKTVAMILVCFFGLAIISIPANLKRARTYQRLINELDSLKS